MVAETCGFLGRKSVSGPSVASSSSRPAPSARPFPSPAPTPCARPFPSLAQRHSPEQVRDSHDAIRSHEFVVRTTPFARRFPSLAERRCGVCFQAKPENTEPPQPHLGRIRSRSPEKTGVNKLGEAERQAVVKQARIARRVGRGRSAKPNQWPSAKLWIRKQGSPSANGLRRSANTNLRSPGIDTFPLEHLHQGGSVQPK